MALKAKITKIFSSIDSLDVEFVLYDDTNPGNILSTRIIQLDSSEIAGLSNNAIQTVAVNRIKEIGTQYNNTVLKAAFFQTKVGTEITI